MSIPEYVDAVNRRCREQSITDPKLAAVVDDMLDGPDRRQFLRGSEKLLDEEEINPRNLRSLQLPSQALRALALALLVRGRHLLETLEATDIDALTSHAKDAHLEAVMAEERYAEARALAAAGEPLTPPESRRGLATELEREPTLELLDSVDALLDKWGALDQEGRDLLQATREPWELQIRAAADQTAMAPRVPLDQSPPGPERRPPRDATTIALEAHKEEVAEAQQRAREAARSVARITSRPSALSSTYAIATMMSRLLDGVDDFDNLRLLQRLFDLRDDLAAQGFGKPASRVLRAVTPVDEQRWQAAKLARERHLPTRRRSRPRPPPKPPPKSAWWSRFDPAQIRLAGVVAAAVLVAGVWAMT